MRMPCPKPFSTAQVHSCASAGRSYRAVYERQHYLSSPCRARHASFHDEVPSRRALLAALLVAGAAGAPVQAATEEPLSIQEVKKRLDKNFQEDQYYVSGKLDPTIFADDCKFKDPTVSDQGRDSHGKAVASLFSPETSHVDLISSRVVDKHTIEVAWRLEGVISQLGIPFTMKPYTGKTRMTTDPKTGKIQEHIESWDTSAVDVFVSIFWKGFGAPPAPPAEELKRRAQQA